MKKYKQNTLNLEYQTLITGGLVDGLRLHLRFTLYNQLVWIKAQMDNKRNYFLIEEGLKN